MGLLSDVKITDSHVHIGSIKHFNFLDKYLKDYGIENINLVSLACKGHEAIAQNLICALYKLLYPDNVYAYGSLMYPYYPLDDKIPDEYNFVEQVEKLMAIGFDGIKMLEGKPTLRKKISVPLDSPIFDNYYSYLEEQKIHVIFHVADPETFWVKETAPSFALEKGWFYGNGTFPEKETIYKEIDGILNKFPNLRITFAHFYFLSNFPERAEEFLNRWKNVSLDVTPGREMYDNFSKRTEVWRDFFTKHQNRIVFGTDMEASMFQGGPSDIINTMRRFLETDDKFNNWGFEIKGLKLDQAVVEKIYSKNFESYAGSTPKRINTDVLLDECLRIKNLAESKKELNNYVSEVEEVINMLKEYI
ncbi:MAG TPA: amidohydrolase family protein [Clostridiaceae bacterium]|nr:amidohydrolase family protein [Clostridiaceae bacterium]